VVDEDLSAAESNNLLDLADVPRPQDPLHPPTPSNHGDPTRQLLPQELEDFQGRTRALAQLEGFLIPAPAEQEDLLNLHLVELEGLPIPALEQEGSLTLEQVDSVPIQLEEEAS